MTPREELNLDGLRVIDGAMATELERRGCDLSSGIWSARVLEDSPASIEEVHRSYLQAGADCLLTASYQVSIEGYAEQGLPPEAAAAALRRSVSVAESARTWYRSLSPRHVWIGASLGPYGAILHNGAEYHGNYAISFDQLVQFHAQRIAILAGTNADFLAFETIPSLDEAGAILIALESHPGVAAWLSFTCTDQAHIAHGERLSDCGRLLDGHPQVVAIGINCTAPALILPLLGELRPATRKPIVVYPNSGEIWDASHRAWRGSSDPGDFAAQAAAWYAAGAQAVGGCCRTTPEHIHHIRQTLPASLG
ncbi:MAG TPA: homocysteine S-methyltransferase [Acidisarcina sp.]|nr:homocysteine S-methyltransferase [Acidisarcina sp.]